MVGVVGRISAKKWCGYCHSVFDTYDWICQRDGRPFWDDLSNRGTTVKHDPFRTSFCNVDDLWQRTLFVLQ